MPACPALFISAPASGQGKTTITAGLARLHRRQGRRVTVFKAGPDFLDPMILARASGAPVFTLDLWMVGERECSRLLAEAAAHSDLVLIEGVMGLFDGTPSSADLAAKFGVSVAAVISAKAMAQTFGAVAFGLAHYRADVPFYGALANHVGSPRHAEMLEEAMPRDLRWLGYVAPSEEIGLPSRHLGLYRADEVADIETRIEKAADALSQTALAELPPAVEFRAEPTDAPPDLLNGMHIAIARDAAFSFIYPANVALLAALGARVSYFSPLADEPVPVGADALYLPGGYPELHAATLATNERTAHSIRSHVAAQKPLVAECGGMLYLLEGLTDTAGTQHGMLGLLPGHATMQTRLAALGMQQIGTPHGIMTGHTFHYSRLDTPLVPVAHTRRASSDDPGERIFRQGPIFATYMHGYWPSNPELTAALFRDPSSAL